MYKNKNLLWTLVIISLLITSVGLASAVSSLDYQGGVIYWPTSDGNSYVKNWTGNSFSSSEQEMEVTTGAEKGRYVDTDYSVGKTIGLLVATTSAADNDALLFNTSSGTKISSQALTGNGGTALGMSSTGFIWNGTNEGIVWYEDADKGSNKNVYFRNVTASGFGSENTYTYTSGSNSAARGFSVAQINSTHYTMVFYDSGDDTVVHTIWKRGAITPEYENVIATGNMNQDKKVVVSVTSDGKGIFFGNTNNTGFDQRFVYVFYNVTTNTTSEPFTMFSDLDANYDDVHMCNVPGYNNLAGVIASDQFGGVQAHIIHANGTTVEDPSRDSSSTRSNGCFPDYEANAVVFYYGNSGNQGYSLYYNGSMSSASMGGGDSFSIGNSTMSEVWHSSTPYKKSASFMVIDSNNDFYAGAYWNSTSMSINNQTSFLINNSFSDDDYQAGGMYFLAVVSEESPTNNAPSSSINKPSNGSTFYDQTNLTAEYLGTDAENATLTSTIYLNGTANETNNSLSNNTVWTKNIEGLGYGTHNVIFEVCDGTNCTNSTQLTITLSASPVSGDLSPVINLTFNNAGNRLEDSTGLHTFNNNGVSFSDNASICLWYGCATDLDGIDYIYTTANFNHSTNGFGFKFWVKHDSLPESNVRPGYFWFQTLGGTDGLTSGEDGTGWQIKAYNTTGNQLTSWFDYDDQTPTDKWYQLGMVYNATTCSWKYYRDGSLYATRSDGCIDMTDAVDGLTTRIFNGRYWEGGGGAGDYHMDEFVWFNNTDGLTDVWFLNEYNEKRLGTPPNADLYIPKISYSLPINWSNDRNQLITGSNVTINITIKNQGTENANLTRWEFWWDRSVADAYANTTNQGTVPCTGYVQLNGGENTTVQCNLTTNGFWYGYVVVDTNNNNSEDVENNNNQTVIVPFVNRPWFHFNETEWLTAETVVNNYEVSKDDYTWSDYGGCSAFNNGYDCDDIDPYGKYARTCSFSCVRHNYTGYGCDQARVHLEGWSNRSMTSCTKVQNLHEAGHVGIAYDMMFPNMTKEQAIDWADGLEDMCQAITNLVDPQLDDDDRIAWDNGQGFSSGFASLCYAIMGAEVDNPTLIQEKSDAYYGSNIPTEWMERERRFTRGYGDGNQTNYGEGMDYKWYSQYHYVDNGLFHQRWKFFDVSDYQPALDSMALEIVLDTLDFNYNGQSLRNDADQKQRFIQRGDSRSYSNPADGSTLNRAVFTLAGLMSTNKSVQQAILYVRNQSNYVGDADIVDGWADAYAYPLLAQKVNYELVNNVTTIMPQVFWDYRNDILTVRQTFSYVDDTVIQIDGGEEDMAGHSFAQGYYLYALGEPFLDYEQVSYQDDVKPEMWKNGLSMHNMTNTAEGSSPDSYYNAQCNNAELSQYYGGTCQSLYYSSDWPDLRQMYENNTGDINETFWTEDGKIVAARVWRPQSQAKTTQEYFVKYEDLLIIRNFVAESTTGESYHNYINIYDEFNQSFEGYNFNLSRGDKILETRIVYTNVTPTLGGGETNVSYCFDKDDCSGANRGSGNYSRLYHHFNSDGAEYVLVHQWYVNGSQTPYTTSLDGDDVVINRSDELVVLDIDNDGVTYGGFTTDGWSLMVLNSTHVAVNNATFVNNGTDNVTLPTSPYNGLLEFAAGGPPPVVTNNPIIVYLNYPGNNSVFNQSWINLSTYFIDPENNTATIQRYINGTINGTNATAQNNTLWVQNLTLGYDTFTVYFNASDGEYDNQTDVYTFTLQCLVDWQNTSWVNNTGSCQENNTLTYSAYLTQYDANNCPGSTNTTYWENGTASCDYYTDGVYFKAYNILNDSVENITVYVNDTHAVINQTSVSHKLVNDSTEYNGTVAASGVWTAIKTYYAGTDFRNDSNHTKFSVNAKIDSTISNRAVRFRIGHSDGSTTTTSQTSGISDSTFTWVEKTGYWENVTNVTVEGNQADGGSRTGYVKDFSTTSVYQIPFRTLYNGTYLIKVENNSYYNKTTLVNINSYGLYNITGLYQTIVNVTAYEINSNNSVNSYTINFTDTTNSVTNFYEATIGNYSVKAMNNTNYTITLDTNGTYARTNNQQNITTTTNIKNVEFYLYFFNSLFITYKDEDTLVTIDYETINLELVSTLYANNYTTNNGTIYPTGLEPGDYRSISGANGYEDRYYYFTLENDTSSNLTLYLINSTKVYNLTVTIIDQDGEEVPGAIVKSKKYYIVTNSYVVQESQETNIEGKVYFTVTDDQYWQFVVEYEGETVYTTTPQLIKTDSLTIQVILGEEITEVYDEFRSIDYTLTYSTTTDNFRLLYNNAAGISTNMCLYVYRKSYDGQTLLNTSCNTAGAATILLPITPVNGTTYLAKAYYTDSDSDVYYLASLTHTEPSSNVFGYTGLLIQLLITVAFLFIGLWNPSVAAITTPLSLLIGGFIGLHQIPTEYTAPLVVGGFILAYMMSKRT